MNLLYFIYRFLHRLRVKFMIQTLPFLRKGTGLSIVDLPIYCINHNVSLGNNIRLYPGVTFLGDGPIIIGDNAKLGNNVVIYATKGAGVKIGAKTIIAANTYIIDCNHRIKTGVFIQDQGLEATEIYIGEDVWIGASSVLAKGTRIESHSVIGANSFVNKEICENSIAVGSPARVIKKRNE